LEIRGWLGQFLFIFGKGFQINFFPKLEAWKFLFEGFIKEAKFWDLGRFGEGGLFYSFLNRKPLDYTFPDLERGPN